MLSARLALALIACASASIGPAVAEKGFPEPNWQVKYHSGPLGIKAGTWLEVAFFATDHEQSVEAQPVLTIPLGQISVVDFDPKAERDSELLQRMPRSGCASARSKMPTSTQQVASVLIVVQTPPGRAARLLEKLNQRHSVGISWRNGAVSSLFVRVDHCEYASFIANLRQSLGPRWQKVVVERK